MQSTNTIESTEKVNESDARDLNSTNPRWILPVLLETFVLIAGISWILSTSDKTPLWVKILATSIGSVVFGAVVLKFALESQKDSHRRP